MIIKDGKDGPATKKLKDTEDWYSMRSSARDVKTFPRSHPPSEAYDKGYDQIDWSKGKKMGKHRKGKTSIAYNA